MSDEVIYQYTDEAGDLLFEVVRGPGKKFLQRRPNGEGGYTYNLGDLERVPYRLPDLKAAVTAGRTVWITEGEKDADALAELGLAATCNPGGACKWRPEYSTHLEGARVVIVRDMDDVGLEHAKQVASALKGIAKHIEVVAPAEGKDAADHLSAHYGPDEFIPIELEPAIFADVAGILAGNIKRPQPTIFCREDGQGLLYPGKTHAIQSEPSLGKTFIALAACRQEMENGKGVVYLDWEGDVYVILDRLIQLGVDKALLADTFFYANPPKLSADYCRRIIDSVAAQDVTLVVLDGVARALAAQGLSENKADEYLAWTEMLPKPLSVAGAAVLMLDHVVKDREGQGRFARGTGAKLGEVDVAYWLKGLGSFSRHSAGRVAIKVAKDRLGCVGAIGDEVAVIHVEQADSQNIHLTIGQPEMGRQSEDGTTFREHVRTQTLTTLKAAPYPGLSQNAVERMVTGSAIMIRSVLTELVDEGLVCRRRRGNGYAYAVADQALEEAF